jgi:hypothetical protein
MQRDLPLKAEMQRVDRAIVASQPDMSAAIVLTQTIAGLSDGEISDALKMDKAQWSRIKSGGAHFPHDRLCMFMDACGNEVPLHWLAQRRGYELMPMETELERQLRVKEQENERIRAENSVLRGLLVGRQV